MPWRTCCCSRAVWNRSGSALSAGGSGQAEARLDPTPECPPLHSPRGLTRAVSPSLTTRALAHNTLSGPHDDVYCCSQVFFFFFFFFFFPKGICQAERFSELETFILKNLHHVRIHENGNSKQGCPVASRGHVGSPWPPTSLHALGAGEGLNVGAFARD